MISKNFASDLLNLICGVSNDVSMPKDLYLGLCSDEPDATTGAITGEPAIDNTGATTGYQRQLVGGSNNEKDFSDSIGTGVISNSKEIHLNVANSNWGQMNYFFLSESESGNAILWGTINGDAGVQIPANHVPVFKKGYLKISIDTALS